MVTLALVLLTALIAHHLTLARARSERRTDLAISLIRDHIHHLHTVRNRLVDMPEMVVNDLSSEMQTLHETMEMITIVATDETRMAASAARSGIASLMEARMKDDESFSDELDKFDKLRDEFAIRAGIDYGILNPTLIKPGWRYKVYKYLIE